MNEMKIPAGHQIKINKKVEKLKSQLAEEPKKPQTEAPKS